MTQKTQLSILALPGAVMSFQPKGSFPTPAFRTYNVPTGTSAYTGDVDNRTYKATDSGGQRKSEQTTRTHRVNIPDRETDST